MPTPISRPKESGLLSMAAAGPQCPTAARSIDRRQEFDNILAHSLPRFRRIAMRLLRNPEDAEDAVQDAMLSAHRHIATFDGRSQMATWITSIVINAVRMQIRRRSRRPTLPLDQESNDSNSCLNEWAVDPGPSPEQSLLQRELQALASRLVARLPPAQREALQLRGQDLSIKQAAELLGIPEGTLKARLARARADLHHRFRKLTGATRSRIPDAESKTRDKAHFSRGRNAKRIPVVPITVFQTQGSGKKRDQRLEVARRAAIPQHFVPNSWEVAVEGSSVPA
jgi:RNA polymerase sigma-70 factor (ECF subfamily)